MVFVSLTVDRGLSAELRDLLRSSGFPSEHVQEDLHIEGDDTAIRDHALSRGSVVVTTDFKDFKNSAAQQAGSDRIFAPPCIRICNMPRQGGVPTAPEQFELLKRDLPKVAGELRPGVYIELWKDKEPQIVIRGKDVSPPFKYNWNPPPPDLGGGQSHGR